MSKITINNNKTITFDPKLYNNLLEALEMNEIEIASMCRDGFCNTCRCMLDNGEVSYHKEAIIDEDLVILPCCCTPATDIQITL